MAAPDSIKALVDRFAEHLDDYKSGKYNETQLRLEFLDPFFAALGWDIHNKQGYAEAYKEVIHEDRVKVGGTTKAPDYSFRIGRERKFFVEAKKPSVDVKGDPHPAYQLRRYAWSAKLPVSVVTDFEEFAVYDCRIRPQVKDKASTARIKYLTFREYIDQWDEIAGIFSREAILKGAFDKYAAKKKRRGTAEVDDEFLKEMERWRTALAQHIARNNDVTVRQLNHAVQVIIDRIVFLRICEDRGVEPPNTLRALQNGEAVYARLFERFRHADAKYNSGLFHFEKESGRGEPDTLTPSLEVGDAVLKDIISHLYYPEAPYEFSVLPADILGHIYERFLGSVITLSSTGKTAKVEEKPEVRKAGGVYYTPTYIVDYIVKHTVGELLKDRELTRKGGGKNKQPTMKKPLRVLDPACGSGSFLLGAYQYLLDWHLDFYLENDRDTWATMPRPPIVARSSSSGKAVEDWILAGHERKRILTEHIFGVDIDTQAVEVSKLSLLLKVLEGETIQSLETQSSFLTRHERALPDLSDNIKCGNSLIGSDFYENEQATMFDEEEHYRINAFDWDDEFADIMEDGGFEAVIGNPPYRKERDYKELMREIARTAWGRRHKSARMDLWYYFVHRGLDVLKTGGVLSFIVSSYWTSSSGADKLIRRLARLNVREFFALSNLEVFRDVSGLHMILRVQNERRRNEIVVKTAVRNGTASAEPYFDGRMDASKYLKKPEQVFHDDKVDLEPPADNLIQKMASHEPLSRVGEVRQGIAENPAWINSRTNKRYGNRFTVGEGVFSLTPDELEKLDLSEQETELIRPYHDLCDLGRFRLAGPSRRLIYSTKVTCPDIDAVPSLRDHLEKFRPITSTRRETKRGSNEWWHLHWPRDERIWKSPKVLSIQMGSRPSFVLAHHPTYVGFSVNVFVRYCQANLALEYFTGVLNSRLLWKWFQHNAKYRGANLEINGNVLRRAPVRGIDLEDSEDATRHDHMVKLVQSMLDMNKRLHGDEGAKMTPQERKHLKSRIESTDREIDRLVYDLYGLTDEEIAIVEAATAE